MYQFTSLALFILYIQMKVFWYNSKRVAPFGNLRISSCVHLPEAYRSLPRPSSPPCTKASSVCS